MPQRVEQRVRNATIYDVHEARRIAVDAAAAAADTMAIRCDCRRRAKYLRGEPIAEAEIARKL